MKKHFGIITGILGIMLTVTGIVFRQKQSMSVGIIGGPDGRTSIYVTGELNRDIFAFFIVTGIIFLILAGVILYKCKH